METAQDFRVLLYYRFTPLPDPAAEREAQHALALELGLKGRILIAAEGLNGTVSGPRRATDRWKEYHRSHPQWHNMEFKEDPCVGHVFPRLSIKVRPEVIAMDYPLDAPKPNAPYIEPEEMRQLLRNPDPDTVILDTRSTYETEVGRFRGAVSLPVESFRELAERIDELEAYKNKRLVTYCTGGIRCEKFTALLLEKGFKDVYQLHGGIIRYAHETGGEGFEGQCYVFDDRVVAPVNLVDPVVVGRCKVCHTPTEHMINCASEACNDQVLVCESCAHTLHGCCSTECAAQPDVRAYDGTGLYHRQPNV
jgi:UPF0176 protein